MWIVYMCHCLSWGSWNEQLTAVLRDLRRGEVLCLKRLKRLKILEDVGYEKGRGKKMFHSRGGKTPLYSLQQITRCRTYLHAAWLKRRVDFTSTLSLQILQARNDLGFVQQSEVSISMHHCHPQCGHPRLATARPYHLTFRRCFDWGGVCHK